MLTLTQKHINMLNITHSWWQNQKREKTGEI